jgi:hypothetical protein
VIGWIGKNQGRLFGEIYHYPNGRSNVVGEVSMLGFVVVADVVV